MGKERKDAKMQRREEEMGFLCVLASCAFAFFPSSSRLANPADHFL